jgi:hypothetical protein
LVIAHWSDYGYSETHEIEGARQGTRMRAGLGRGRINHGATDETRVDVTDSQSEEPDG